MSLFSKHQGSFCMFLCLAVFMDSNSDVDVIISETGNDRSEEFVVYDL